MDTTLCFNAELPNENLKKTLHPNLQLSPVGAELSRAAPGRGRLFTALNSSNCLLIRFFPDFLTGSLAR
jgi:hypothetical protein